MFRTYTITGKTTTKNKNMIYNLMKKKYAPLIFSLISGCAYYIIILSFIMTHTAVGGGLLAMYIAPVVICGIALVLVKLIKKNLEDENSRSINTVFWLHVVLCAISIVYLISIF